MRNTGYYQTLGGLDYFIPAPLPPHNPPLELTPEIISLYGQASFALGQLKEMSLRLPDQKRFLKAYVIKEALLSSAIEGIHTTLIDVFTHTLDNTTPSKETQFVLNYTHALETARDMLAKEEFPLVTRVILKAHEALMSGGHGDKASPGKFRQQAVRVGNLVPPPAPDIPSLMSDLEKYINEPSETPPLIKAGLAHVQFETIHPFLDGNGRIGRLLIVLMLIDSGILNIPILYPSYYFKKHHLEYYQRLDRVRTEGDFEGWIVYYLKAMHESAIDAHKRAKDIEMLENSFKDIVQKDKRFAKIRENTQSVFNFLFAQPVTTISDISQQLDKAYNTIQKIVEILTELSILSESADRRNKQYRFEPYLALLEKEYV